VYHYSFRGSFNVSSGLWTAEAKKSNEVSLFAQVLHSFGAEQRPLTVLTRAEF
jgi:hypothetical protein